MTVYLQWQEKKAPEISFPGLVAAAEPYFTDGPYCRVVMAMTPPILPVPNFVVASHER
jgi:hypothetical protein